MYTLIVFAAVISFIYLLITLNKKTFKFFITGLDSGFTFSDLTLLLKVAKICDLEEPTSLFYSMNSLQKCMLQISNITNTSAGDQSLQLVLSKLFDFRTKLQNKSDDKKSIESTLFLEKGQTLRIVLPGKGVFASEIVANGKELVISIPKQKNLIPIPGEEWVNKTINVYLWRKGDARYVFDTTVLHNNVYLGKSALVLKHSNQLVRTQKRKSVRAKCSIYGQLFIVKDPNVDVYSVESRNGYKCMIEDISESGALIRIGGKGVQNVKIKLQFNIKNMLIVMFGVVRTIEFSESRNQTLLHFECINIDPIMRNNVLKYVYDIIPQNEKEILEALEETENDENNENESQQETSTSNQTASYSSETNSNTESTSSETPLQTETANTQAQIISQNTASVASQDKAAIFEQEIPNYGNDNFNIKNNETTNSNSNLKNSENSTNISQSDFISDEDMLD